MTSHDVTVAVYGLVALTGVGLDLRSRSSGSAIPSLAAVFSRVMSSRSGRVGILAGWVWLGLHFFAR